MKKKAENFILGIDAVYFLLPLMLVILSVVGVIGLSNTAKTNEPSAQKSSECTTIGKACYQLERAVTNEQRIKGLSGRESMPNESGMLFVFDYPVKQCMWMKDMQFSNDIIWLDESKKVLKIKENISPNSYPESFCSEEPTRYVIELNGGQIAKNQLKQGDTISL